MKIITTKDAVALIQDDWTITTGGFGHCGSPEALLDALQLRYKEEFHPKNLSLVFASGAGDKNEKGINKLAIKGLLKRIIGGFWSLAPQIGLMASRNEIQAHNWPQGVISHFYRAVASGQVGVISKIGLGTFIDPEQQGGRLNKVTTEELISKIEINNEPHLLYKAMPLHCALLRGTSSDEDGNISMEQEVSTQDVLSQAQAVHNSGGIVIVQVQKIVKTGSLNPQLVQIPRFLVDYVVLAHDEDHWQTYGEKYNPEYTDAWQHENHGNNIDASIPLARKIIARRAMLELMSSIDMKKSRSPLVVNLGIGIPVALAEIAIQSEAYRKENFILTVESGAVGGKPAGGLSFGASHMPDAILSQGAQFDFYNGGGIDISFLGFGQIDSKGRINVSNLGGQINGVGGFINISQTAKQVVFCGAFSAGGLLLDIKNDEVSILKEGSIKKFISNVTTLCFDPAISTKTKPPLLITERAVFQIVPAGLVLIEIAPGVDINRDILSISDAEISISPSLKLMSQKAFSDEPMLHEFFS
jgi:propionate CoA-transferase